MELQNILYIIGNVFIGLGAAFMLFGAIGLFRFKDFYPRILIASKIDTVGLLTLLGGVAIRHGFSFFTAKVLLVVVVVLVLNPLVAHIITSAAYDSGYRLEGTLSEDAEKQGLEETAPEKGEKD